jgi:Ca-activated chloride channel family protein
MNTFNPQDPKWIAYLLGELSVEETREVEQELEANPDAKAFVDSLSGTHQTLSGYFAEEHSLELAPDQKADLADAARRRNTRIPFGAWALPAAAAVTLLLSLPLWLPDSREDVWTEPMPDGSVAGQEELKDLSSEVEVREYETPVNQPVVPPAPPAPEEVAKPSVQPARESTRREQKLSRPSGSLQSLSFDAFSGAPASSRSRAMGLMEQVPTPVISPSQDEFDVIDANVFRRVSDHPLSTFSVDVDTASYAVVRKMLKEGRLPPKDAVRIEELVNYFDYGYAAPADGSPFAAHMQVAPAPWAPEHRLVRVALKGKEIATEERPALNLVYLLDVSGSMNGGNRLPLVKRAMKTLANQLDERDRVAIVVYAGAAGLVLPSTSGENEQAIIEALDRLQAGGSTAGGAGIQLAYQTAREQFVEGGVNRVILCTDGDFNVGLNQTGDLQKLIEREAKSGVQLTILGFGMGNYKDDTLETLSNKGNGNYAYIDDYSEARKVLVDDLLGTMITIAKDVKIQVEFNPTYVGAYRLIGYENRMLNKEDFNNDKIDAGEIGAGHTVTAFYELIPPGLPVPGEAPEVDDLKYQSAAVADRIDAVDTELLTLKLRHKQPDGDTSVKTEYPLPALQRTLAESDADFRFASAVAAFGQWLRDEEFRGRMTLEEILDLGQSGKGEDPFGYRAEFLQLVRTAGSL